MYSARISLVAGMLALLNAAVSAQQSLPPKAAIIPHTMEIHGYTRTDNYYWLKERENPKVIQYLEAENAYKDSVMKPVAELQEKLFQEIKGRIKQTDMSVPVRIDDYRYYTRFEEGKDYPIYCREPVTGGKAEQILLDVNALAGERKGYYRVSNWSVSSKQDLLAFAVDTVGRRIHRIHIKNLTTGQILPDVIENATAVLAWAEDNRTLFYGRQDPQTLRAYQIYRHTIGNDPSSDVLVYEEKDDTFACTVFKTKSRKYLMIASYQTLSTEYRYVDAAKPDAPFTVILARTRDHEYSADHIGSHFYIRTNLGAKNFRLVKAPVGSSTTDSWESVLPHRTDVLLEDFELFKDYLVISERQGGLTQIRIRPWSGKDEHYLAFDEPAYVASLGLNPMLDTPVLRWNYTSLVTPNSVYEYDMGTRKRTLLKQEEVLGGFNHEDYASERVIAPARDGVGVPISLVYRKGIRKDGSAPLLLYGYGAYGFSSDPRFNSTILSLLDRGFIYAMAHIRGGQEMGRDWYESGKLGKKMNTFTDFIDCAEFLIGSSYTAKDRLFAVGGSAGGLLIGAVLNMRPDLWKGVIAAVPFVDVLTTMLDESIPLTTSEYDEWGNPNEKAAYETMAAYSPYDNVRAVDYPNILVTTGLHDSQVQYWEPAKWVARLRTMKTDKNILILKTDMEAGHGGAAARTKRWRDDAFNYAFLLMLTGTTR